MLVNKLVINHLEPELDEAVSATTRLQDKRRSVLAQCRSSAAAVEQSLQVRMPWTHACGWMWVVQLLHSSAHACLRESCTGLLELSLCHPGRVQFLVHHSLRLELQHS